MPYFRKESDGQVVFRRHEFNSEALNGDIVKIGDNSDCILLVHVATKKFNWAVKPVENIGPEKGLEKVKDLGTKESSKTGQPFYSLVDSTHLQVYIDYHKDYELSLEDPPKSIEKRKEKKVIKNNPAKEISKRGTQKSQEGQVKREGPVYKPKLQRDVAGEKPIKILN